MRNEGFALTPEDRKNEGLVQIMSVFGNLCVASIDYLGKHKFIQRKKEKDYVKRQIQDLQIKVSDPMLPVMSLSGGNQQKVVDVYKRQIQGRYVSCGTAPGTACDHG